MNIWRKIEEIRQKPDHIKNRYVWGSAIFSMLFVIPIWLYSISMLHKTDEKKPVVNQNQPSFFEQFKEQKQSIREATDQLKQTAEDAKKTIPSLAQETQEETIIGPEGVGVSEKTGLVESEGMTREQAEKMNQQEVMGEEAPVSPR